MAATGAALAPERSLQLNREEDAVEGGGTGGRSRQVELEREVPCGMKGSEHRAPRPIPGTQLPGTPAWPGAGGCGRCAETLRAQNQG